MKKYVLKRLLSLIPTIFIVSVVIFLLVHLTPGDPAAAMLGEDATAAEIAALRSIRSWGWMTRSSCSISAGWAIVCGSTSAHQLPWSESRSAK